MGYYQFSLAYIIITLISISLSTFISIILFFNSRHKDASRTLAVSLLYLSAWTTLNYIALVFENIYVLRILYAIIIFLFPLMIKFTLEFIYKSWGNWWQKIILFMPPFIFAPIIVFTPYSISGIVICNGVIEITNPGILLAYEYVLLVLYLIVALIILVLAAKRMNRLVRFQLGYIWLMMGISLSLATTAQYLLPVLGISTFTPYRSIIALVLTGTIFIVITRFHMLNMIVIFSEIWAFILSIVLLIQLVYDPSVSNIIVFVAVLITAWLVVKSVYVDAARSAELNLLNRQLARDKNELVKLDEAKTEFVTMTSHELLTPISAIEGYLSMLVDEKLFPVNDKKLMKYLKSMYGSARRVAGLVTDLLNVSRIEEHRLKVSRSEFAISSLIKELKDELSAKSESVTIKIIDQANITIPNIYADRDNISEILINLISNAIKYNRPGGKVEIYIDVWPTKKIIKAYNANQRNIQKSTRAVLDRLVESECQILAGNEQVVIAVKDNGIGLTDGDIKLLFKKFSRVIDWEHHSIQGTGLGLYISQALAGMNHGRIWVTSLGRDKGSTFYLSLPPSSNKALIVKLDKCMRVAKDAKPLAKSSDMVDVVM